MSRKNIEKLARKFELKQFEKLGSDAEENRAEIVQTLSNALINASSNMSLGILPFMRMLFADGRVWNLT